MESVASSPYTWTSPLDKIWTYSNTGGSTRLASYSTTLSDDCNFGGPVAGLGGGTVPVDTVNAKSISFNTITGSGTLTVLTGVEPPSAMRLIIR